ncbi:hypothetical protein F4703DRAFT_1792712 [Phycomyces blakesleeanus]
MKWSIKLHPLAIVASGAMTGIVLIAAAAYLFDNHSSRSSLDSSRGGRLRRSRNVRRRRLRVGNSRMTEDQDDGSPVLLGMSDTDDDDDGDGPTSLFKEWNEDDNKNLLNLLHAISDNQSRKGGITCNKCSITPVRGVRYKCANCIDFDLCEMCEGTNSHVNTHVFLKIRIPIPPLSNPRNALLPAFYPGNNINRPPLTHERIRELQDKSHFDKVELEALYEQFKSLATVEKTEPGIDRETFEQCLGPLGLEKNLITERIFAFFDQDRDGMINFGEMVSGFSVLCKGNLDEKIEYAFKGYDLDEDGFISRDELYRMFKSYFYLSMELVRDVVSAMEDEMIDNFEFSASQPVSSAFNVAIPSPASEDSSEDDEENEEENSNRNINANANANTNSTAVTSTDTAITAGTTGTTGTIGTTSSSRQRRRYPAKENYFDEQARNASDPAASLPKDKGGLIGSDNSDNGDKGGKRSWEKEKMADQGKKKAWEEKFPIMETMSQDAINEMVEKTFKSIDTVRDGYISFEEFKRCVQADSSIVSWFEALGTVF